MEDETEKIALDVEPSNQNGTADGRLLLKLRARRTARQAELEPQGTEALLNSLIGECREMMRDLSDYARYIADPNDRTQVSTAAARIALIGARVGKGIGKLRNPVSAKVREHRYVVEHRELNAHAPAQARPPGSEGGELKT